MESKVAVSATIRTGILSNNITGRDLISLIDMDSIPSYPKMSAYLWLYHVVSIVYSISISMPIPISTSIPISISTSIYPSMQHFSGLGISVEPLPVLARASANSGMIWCKCFLRINFIYFMVQAFGFWRNTFWRNTTSDFFSERPICDADSIFFSVTSSCLTGTWASFAAKPWVLILTVKPVFLIIICLCGKAHRR